LWHRLGRWFGGGGPRVVQGPQRGEPAGLVAPLAQAVTWDTAMQVSAWWACVRLLTETCATLPLRLLDLRGGYPRRDDDDPAIRLLRNKPNAIHDRIQFFEILFLNLVTNGNAYARVYRREDGSVYSLVPMLAAQTEPELVGNTLRYRWSDGVNVAYLAQESVMHVKLFGNGLVGLSPLAYAAHALGIAQAEARQVSNVYRKGMRPAGVLMVDAKLDKEQRNQIRESFRDLVEQNDGNELVVLDRFMKYEATSLSPADAELLQSRRFSVQDIARFHGINSIFVNDGSQSTTWGSGIEQLMDGAYKLTFRPLLERMELALKLTMFPPERWDEVEFRFDFDEITRMNPMQRAQTAREQIHSGQRTPNEVRALDGFPPLPGGDTLMIQSATRPITEAQEATI
jgi:HK97 family phage portal protein